MSEKDSRFKTNLIMYINPSTDHRVKEGLFYIGVPQYYPESIFNTVKSRLHRL